jgi:hypothetical protein
MVSTFLPDSIKFKSLISKATADDEVPTPGYIHEELKQVRAIFFTISSIQRSYSTLLLIISLGEQSWNVLLGHTTEIRAC